MFDLQYENLARVTRRQFFGSTAGGIGLTALASLMNGSAAEAAEKGIPGVPHHLPKAKRVIVMWQGGGPSHVDLFDEKPMMQEMKGKAKEGDIVRITGKSLDDLQAAQGVLRTDLADQPLTFDNYRK